MALIESLEFVQYLFRIVGTAIGGVGALVVRYHNISNQRVKALLRNIVPGVTAIEDAWEEFESRGTARITDPEQLKILEEFFERRYDMERDGDVQAISQVSTGMELEYPDGSVRSPFNERESWRIERRQFFVWALSQYVTERGMWLIAIGFVLTLVGLL